MAPGFGKYMLNSFMPQSGTGMLGSYTGMNGLGGYGSFDYGSLGGLTGYGNTNYNVVAGFAIGNALLGCAKQYLTCHAGKVGGSSENDTIRTQLNEVIITLKSKTESAIDLDIDIKNAEKRISDAKNIIKDKNLKALTGENGKLTLDAKNAADAYTAVKNNSEATEEERKAALENLNTANQALEEAKTELAKQEEIIETAKKEIETKTKELDTVNKDIKELNEKKEKLEKQLDESTLPKKQSQKIAEKNFGPNNRAKENDIMQLMANFNIVTNADEKRAAAEKFRDAYNSNGNFAKNAQYTRYYNEVQDWLKDHPAEKA